VIPIVYEMSNLDQDRKTPNGVGTCEFPPARPALLVSPPSSGHTDVADGSTPENEHYDYQSPFKVREVAHVKYPAFHADLVSLFKKTLQPHFLCGLRIRKDAIC
jgi:hypothetical protein